MKCHRPYGPDGGRWPRSSLGEKLRREHRWRANLEWLGGRVFNPEGSQTLAGGRGRRPIPPETSPNIRQHREGVPEPSFRAPVPFKRVRRLPYPTSASSGTGGAGAVQMAARATANANSSGCGQT